MSDLNTQHLAFKQQLFDHKLLFGSGVNGIVGRSSKIVELVAALHGMVDKESVKDGAQKVAFPPVVPRELLRTVGYMNNFPQLSGSIHSFSGDDRQHLALQETVKNGEDWSPHLSQTDVTLTPASCYPLYPTLAGNLPEGGALFDLNCYCFRHEPSNDPARLMSFEIRENVRAGSPEEVQKWRHSWLDRGHNLLESLGLSVVLDTASDPFFGRGGRMMKASQKELELKFELLVDIWGKDNPTACASFNYHQDHFSHLFGIHLADGADAHTACLGFGIDRLVIALLKTHGFDMNAWPASVREKLAL
ncbi:amino acid--[acyl-carrier-protein] ligase [Methylotenera sp.]|uniref:amino acid--[acyl-carrier-protein] ligase n=1 Tax=Methylotenera sp. TaxID=2051956 RepID=UPI002489B164|nr:amino acid--[acyl-carrier-protein] ligase [Methylotenera sp.]MDI1297811.1 amino acid--[acyl-carrier-protein] ligase [Methylotenera sp.]